MIFNRHVEISDKFYKVQNHIQLHVLKKTDTGFHLKDKQTEKHEKKKQNKTKRNEDNHIH